MEVDDEPDGSIEAAASAMEALLKATPSSEPEPKPALAPQPNSPQAPADEPSEPDNAAVEGDQVVQTAEPTPAVPTPKPATQAADIPPDVQQRLQEADKAKSEATAALNQYTERLNVLVPQMEQKLLGQYADVKDISDLRALADPTSERYNIDRYNGFILARAELQQYQQERDRALQAQKHTETETQNKWRAAEQEKLGKLIPDLNDPEKGPILARNLQEYARKEGFTSEQMSQWSAAHVVALHKAMRYEGLQAAQELAKQKAAKAPPVQTPGVQRPTSSKDEKLQTDFERLKKTGRQDAAAAVFRHFL